MNKCISEGLMQITAWYCSRKNYFWSTDNHFQFDGNLKYCRLKSELAGQQSESLWTT